MNVTVVTCTWNRPEYLGRLIHCFLNQDTVYDCKLYILDDAGQYDSQAHDKWKLVSLDRRYPTLGAKRNAAIQQARIAFPETQAIAIGDDDDVYFPHWLTAVIEALSKKPWAQPRLVMEPEYSQACTAGRPLTAAEFERECEPSISLKVIRTYRKGALPVELIAPLGIAYGGSWAWRVHVFDEIGGFAHRNIGEDTDYAFQCGEFYGLSADSTATCQPWYVYWRRPGQMMSEIPNAYEKRGEEPIEFVGTPPIGWNGPNVYELPIQPGVQERPF